MATAREQLKFNLRCRNNNILPKSLRFSPPIKTKEAFKIAFHTGKQYLNCFIKNDHFRIRKYSNEINSISENLNNVLPSHLYNFIKSTAIQKCTSKKSYEKLKLKAKYDHLCNSQVTNELRPYDNWVRNLSSKNLTKEEEKVLSKGLNFSLKHNNKDKLDLLSTIEPIIENIKDISPSERSQLRLQTVSAIKSSKAENNLTANEKEALTNLKQDPNIAIVPADKGKTTVILNKSDYEAKIESFLDDKDTYEIVNGNPSKKIQNKLNTKLKSLEKEKKLSRNQYLKLHSNNLNIPKFYGLIKLHKEGHPIRPIVAFCDTPTDQLSKFITQILNPLTDFAPQKLKNSKKAKDNLENITIPSDHMMVSFDVKALYTSIPPKFALETLENFLNKHVSSIKTTLSKEDIIDLTKICLDSNIFSWKNNIYKQIHGTPMGSSISVVLAEICMQAIEDVIFEKVGNLISIWMRYVDDVFAIIPIDKKDFIFNTINNINDSINFTIEEEQNNKISFLDLSIVRKHNGNLTFNVYRKPTHTDRYLDFNSNNVTSQKRNVVNSLYNRAKSLCSDENKTEEFEYLRNVLKFNNYPAKFIKDTMNHNDQKVTLQDHNNTSYFSAPYVKGASERLNRIFKKYDIQFGFKSRNTIKSHLCHLKDKHSNEDSCGVVYQVPCKDCEDIYVGETGRSLGTRIKEHQNNVKKFNPNSLIFNHLLENDHSIDWHNSKILAQSSHQKPRQFLESAFSKTKVTSYNRSGEIPEVYLPLINTLICN